MLKRKKTNNSTHTTEKTEKHEYHTTGVISGAPELYADPDPHETYVSHFSTNAVVSLIQEL